jgi:hypothetical protein
VNWKYLPAYHVCLFLVRFQRYIRLERAVAKMRYQLDTVRPFRPGEVMVKDGSKKLQRENDAYNRFVDRFIAHYEDMHYYNVTQATFYGTIAHCCALYDTAMRTSWDPSTCYVSIAKLAASRLPQVRLRVCDVSHQCLLMVSCSAAC